MTLVALMLALLGAGSDDSDCGRQGDRCKEGSNRARSGLAWFEFAPASGAGLPSAVNLCDTLTAADLGTNFYCLNGDKTTAMRGGDILPFGESGTVNAWSQTVCPSGPNCASKTGFSGTTSSSGLRESADVDRNALDTQGFTLCWHGSAIYSGAERELMGISTNGSGGWRSLVWVGSGVANLYLPASGGGCSSGGSVSGATTLADNSINLICHVYDYSAGYHRLYVNGAQDGVSGGIYTNGACRGGNPSRHVVGGYWNLGGVANSPTDARTLGAFYVETPMSASRIAAIARAVLADAPTGARGEALSETRASVQFCESSDGTGTLLPNNRLCVTRGGTTAAQGSFVQQLLRTEELDNAAWSSQNGGGAAAVVVTQNYAVGRGGTLTAERIQSDATGVGGYSQRWQNGACPASTTGVSGYCWVKGNGTSGTTDFSIFTGSGWANAACPYTSSSWTQCKLENLTTTVSPQLFIGNATIVNGGVARSAADILVSDCNCTNTANVRPYIPATSAAVTTAAEVPYLTLTNAPALASMEATYDQPASVTTNQRVMQPYKDANNTVAMYLDTGYSPPKLVCYWTVGGINYAGVGPTSSNSATHRGSCSYDGTNIISCVDGTCTSTAQSFTNFSGATRVYLGAYFSTGFELSPTYVLRGVKADPSPTRFR